MEATTELALVYISSAWNALLSVLKEPEFYSAIVGALVGAMAAIIAQRMGIRAEREKRQQESFQFKQALGFSALIKVRRIHSDIHGIREHFDEAFNAMTPDQEAWMRVLPIANILDPISITESEKYVLFTDGDAEALSSIIDLDAIHAGLIVTVRKFNSERRELTDLIAPTTFKDGAASTELEKSDYLKLAPRMYDVNNLAHQIHQRAKRDEEDAMLGPGPIKLLA